MANKEEREQQQQAEEQQRRQAQQVKDQQAQQAQAQARAQQQQQAQNTQVNANAGVPATGNQQAQQQLTQEQANAARIAAQNNVPIQTVPNVSPTQAQADLQAQTTINQNLKGDFDANLNNENLTLLKRIVGLASPIMEDVQETQESTDAAGNKVQTPVFKKVTKGYNYYAVDGKPFEDWVNETFNGEVSIDTENNKIIYTREEQQPQSQQ